MKYNKDEVEEVAEKAVSKWGKWAKWFIYALALTVFITLWLLGLWGCSLNYSQSADGATSFNSEFDPAGLTFDKDGNVSYQGKTIVVIPQKK